MEKFNFQILSDYTQSIIISLVVILMIGVVIWLINRGSTYLKNKVLNLKSNFLKIQNFELIHLGKQQLILIGLINFFRIVAILLSINFSLLIILSLFPSTNELVTKFHDFIFIPIKSVFFSVLDYLPKLFKILITIIIFRYLFKLVKILAVEIEKGTLRISAFNPLWVKTTAKIINFLLLAFLLIMIIPLLPGYESLAFKGVATFLAALITIGGSSVIANFMAGIVISYMNPCKVGDWIQIENTTGEVIEMSQFAIKIQTAKKIMVSIPYTKGLGSHIINYSGEKENHKILLHTTISISYEVTWEKVNELLISAASLTEYIDHSIPAFVSQLKLDDFYIVYELNAYTTDVHQMQYIYSELHKHILDVFNKAKIEILSPHYRVER
jgi:small-conductance mechanosensitive channel